MSVPVVGAGITVVWKPRRWGDPLQLRRAYVYQLGPEPQSHVGRGTRIDWESGSVRGEVWEKDEYVEWISGHGPQARAALLAARALAR